MEVYLETERVVLRRFTGADVDNLVELDGDPDVMRFVNGGPPTPREEIEGEILPAFLRYYERGDGYGFWAAIEKSTGDFLGWFHFRPAKGAGPDEPELGYRLRKAAWGKGYATEVSRALISRGFAELGVRRVVASTYQDNLASRRVMEKAGMRLVRTYRLTAEELEEYGITSPELFDGDDVEYAIEKADWERREAAGAPQASIPGDDHNAE
jgi:RimJ/RimL family protein N-acetyltransferase